MKLSAEQIAAAIGRTASLVRKRATRDNWDYEQVPCNGGLRKEYPLAQLPADIQKAIAKKEAAKAKENLPALRAETLPAVQAQPVESLKGWQREIYQARMLVLRELDKLERELGGTNKAMREIIRLAKDGELPQYLQMAVAAANARKGDGRTLSQSSLELWRRKAARGELAPVDTERKDDPPWAEYFKVCWHKPGRPSEPQAVKNMLKLLPPEIAAPSYWQVRRWNQKRPLIEREQGRRTGGEMRALKPYWERETRDLRPLEVCLCDGHSFKVEIKSWQNGRPIHPEICYAVDVASRAVLGWSIGLAETVMTAVLRAAMHGPENPFGGVPNMLYTDMGSGNMAEVNTNEVYGFFAKLGITHETGIPGNAQGRGLIERLNKTLWIRAAREMPSCTHAMFDRLAARNYHIAVERDYAKKGDTELLLSVARQKKRAAFALMRRRLDKARWPDVC